MHLFILSPKASPENKARFVAFLDHLYDQKLINEVSCLDSSIKQYVSDVDSLSKLLVNNHVDKINSFLMENETPVGLVTDPKNAAILVSAFSGSVDRIFYFYDTTGDTLDHPQCVPIRLGSGTRWTPEKQASIFQMASKEWESTN